MKMFSQNLHNLYIGDEYPKQVNCVIEIPKGKNTKYEYDEKLQVFKLTRCLISSLNYPINYGFIPQTIAQDGDPLDVLVYNHDPLDVGTIAECRVIGILDFTDKGEIDNKILAVPKHAPLEKYAKLSDFDISFLKIIKHFFRIYKEDINIDVQVGEWHNGKKALSIVKSAHERYLKSVNLNNENNN